MEITGLFPTPIGFFELNREFTKQELKCFSKLQKDTYNNTSNKTSNNTFVLDLPELASLKLDVLKSVQEFATRVSGLSSDNEVYITQSWLNYTTKGESHHKHFHSNSFLSGVLYIDADPFADQITFYDSREVYHLDFEPTHYNDFNSRSWRFPVKSKSIVIFPSDTLHGVDTKHSSNLRTSLAFNTYIHGTLGDHKRLNQILLPK